VLEVFGIKLRESEPLRVGPEMTKDKMNVGVARRARASSLL
jgi:hypothetical protein